MVSFRKRGDLHGQSKENPRRSACGGNRRKRRLNDEGVSVLMITHDADIAAHAKRVVTIKDGILQEKR